MGLCKGGKPKKKNHIRPIGYKKPKVDMKRVTYQQMHAIPDTEEDLLKVPVHINMRKKEIVDEMLKASDIRCPALRLIFIGEEKEAIEAVNTIQREDKWLSGFQFDLLTAFWLAVHYKRISVINHVVQYDIYLRQLVTLALKGKPERPRGFRPDKKVAKDCIFNKVAGITSENEHLAGIGVKRDDTSDMHFGDYQLKVPAASDQKPSTFLPPIKTNTVRPGPLFEPNFDQRDGDIVMQEPIETGRSPDDNIPVSRKLQFEGGSKEDKALQFEGGSQEDVPEEFREELDEAVISRSFSSEYSGEGEGDGEGDSDESGVSGGTREDIEDFRAPLIGGKRNMAMGMGSQRHLSTLNSEQLTQINLGAQDDSQSPFTEQSVAQRPPEIRMNDENNEAYLRQRGITGLDIEMMKIETEEDVDQLCAAFRLYFPVFMASIVKILLYKKEQKLACFLTAYYELSLEEDSYYLAVDQKYFQWLEYVWAFGKNYVGSRRQESANKLNIKALLEIIRRVHNKNTRKIEECCEIVCQWFIMGEEDEHNMLWALLSQYQEPLALQYMGYYSHFLEKGLFVYALSNNNTTFMQKALQMEAFDKQMYTDPMVVQTMLAFFKDDGSKTNFILNVLLLTDITLWKTHYLEELIDIFEEYLEGNQLLLSYNPLMSIALTCDLLTKIGAQRKMFRDRCNDMLDVLLSLGEIYSSKIDDEEYYKDLIKDKDFNGRSVLNIICYSQFQQLMSEQDPKAENLIRNIWHGDEFTKCDGNIFGYSNLTHILLSRAKRADATTGFFEIVTAGFMRNFQVDYTFQFKYRSMAISEYFFKDILLAFVMVIWFRSINEEYRTLFMGPLLYVGDVTDPVTGLVTQVVTETHSSYDFDNYDPQPQIRLPKERSEMLKNNLESFSEYYPHILFLCGSLCYSVALKLLFNTCAKEGKDYRVPLDMWTKFDLVSAVATIAGIPFILMTSPDQMMAKNVKDILDYIMLAIILLQWGRFYLFFLMISELSKMILTFIAMVIDTIAFMFLVISYLVIAAAIFTTMFQDINPSVYGTFQLSLRSLFDGLMAAYSYKGFGDMEMLHMVMLVLHILLSNILLLNYLIAILSQSYSVMLDKGTFLYKVYLYQYCERYMVGLANPEYGQLVIYPAPINYLNFPILLLAIVPRIPPIVLRTASEYFALLMFWLENIFQLGIFVLYEAALIPFVYFKNIVVVAWATQGLFLTIFNTFAWIVSGLIILVFLVLRDVIYMFRILTMHKGCRHAAGLQDELPQMEIDDDLEVRCFNEAREIVIRKYFEVKKVIENKMDEGEEPEVDIDNLNILTMLDGDAELIDENRVQFIIKASSLVDAWRKEDTARMKAEEEEVNQKDQKKNTVVESDNQREAREKAEQEKMRQNDSKIGQLKQEFVTKAAGETEQIVSNFIERVAECNGNDEEDELQEEQEQEPEPEIILTPDEKAENLVEAFFDKFLVNSEGSATNDNVDITWLLQAVPTRVLKLNISQVRKFNFLTLQNAIIAFENADVVKSFDFYDKKNGKRVNKVKDIVVNQMKDLKKIERGLQDVKEKLQKNEKFLREYEEMTAQWEIDKKRIAENAADKAAEEMKSNNERGQSVDHAKKGSKKKKSKK